MGRDRGRCRRLRERGALPAGTSPRSRSRRSGRARCAVDRDGEPSATPLIWMDSRGAEEVARVVGGRVQGPGLRRRASCASGSRSPAVPVAVRQGPDRPTSCGCEAERPELSARTCDVPRAQGLPQPAADRRRASPPTTRSSCTGSPTTATRRPRSTTSDELLDLVGLDRAWLPDLVPGHRRSSARSPPRPPPSSGCGPRHARDRRHAATCSRPPSAPARCATSRATSTSARRRGSPATCRSRRPTCCTASRRCPRRSPAATSWPTSRRRRAPASTGCATTCCTRTTRCGPAAPGRRLRPDRRASPPPPGRANGVIFTPWLNGERTPVDDHTIRAGWHNLSLAHRPGRPGPGRARGRRVQHPVDARRRREVHRPPVPVAQLHRRRRPAPQLWCQIHADVLDRPIRQVEHPIRANARGAGAAGRRRAGHAWASTISAAKVKVVEPCTSRTRPTADLRRAVRRLPRRSTSRTRASTGASTARVATGRATCPRERTIMADTSTTGPEARTQARRPAAWTRPPRPRRRCTRTGGATSPTTASPTGAAPRRDPGRDAGHARRGGGAAGRTAIASGARVPRRRRTTSSS